MPQPVDEEALRRLDERADALQARTARPVRDYGANAVGAGYRLLAELIGGVVVGLAIGFGIDALTGARPWGLVGGVLIGAAVGMVMAVSSARRLSVRMQEEVGPPQAVPFDDEEDDR